MNKLQNLLFFFFFSVLAFSANGQTKDSTSSNLVVIEQEGIQELVDILHENIKEQGGIEGYRVQIFNGRKTPCMDKRMQFMKSHSEESIEIIYESPEYKVQVGNFRTRLEAEKYLKAILEEFSGSFVVKTMIKLPKLD